MGTIFASFIYIIIILIACLHVLAILKLRIPKDKIKCCICGEEEDPSHYNDETKNELEENNMCFTCNHWRLQKELDEKKREKYSYAIVDGTHYVLCPKTSLNWPKGFGGRLFKFKFNDGTVRECSNVWCQGDLNEAHHYWREIFKDNAVIESCK